MRRHASYPEDKSTDLVRALAAHFGSRWFDASSIVTGIPPDGLAAKLAFLGVRTTKTHGDLDRRSSRNRVDKWLRRYVVGHTFDGLLVEEDPQGWVRIYPLADRVNRVDGVTGPCAVDLSVDSDS